MFKRLAMLLTFTAGSALGAIAETAEQAQTRFYSQCWADRCAQIELQMHRDLSASGLSSADQQAIFDRTESTLAACSTGCEEFMTDRFMEWLDDN
jgi:hypothetical protein